MTAPDTPTRPRWGIPLVLVLIAPIVVVLVAVLLLLRPLSANYVFPTPDERDHAPVGNSFDVTAAEATLWQLVNGARLNAGLPPLTRNDTLVSIARWRSQDMIRRLYFSYTILGTSYQVDHWYDLEGLEYSLAGESIAWNNGYSEADSPRAIHNGMMNSPGDRATILNPAFTEAGVGAYGRNNVQFLGSLRSPRVYTLLFLAPEPTPAPSE